MNAKETAGLLMYIVGLDKRMTPAGALDAQIQRKAWYEVLINVPYADAEAAVRAHYSQPAPRMVTTGDILAYRRAPVPMTRDRAVEQADQAKAVPMPAHLRDELPEGVRRIAAGLRIPCPWPPCGREIGRPCRNPATGTDARTMHDIRITTALEDQQ